MQMAWVVWLAVVMTGCYTRRLTVPIMPPLIGPPKARVLWSESFDRLDPDRWREVVVQGHTQYQALVLEERPCLEAKSRSAASILLSAVRFDPDEYEWLSWDWRVDRLVDDEALDRKDGSDAAARVYVYFETAGLPWQKRSLDYVWSATLPVDTLLASAYSPESKMIVVHSGADALGQWRSVQRNLQDDYARAFGDSDPPDVIAIGLMTDTDNTGSEALAYFDDLRISRHALHANPPSRR